MNGKAYDAIDVANYIVNYCIDESMPVSNLKLQKLLYYVQAASLVETGRRMFADEISAWKYGPVVENVYHSFKLYVDKEIVDKVTEKYSFLDFEQEDYDPMEMILETDQPIIQRVTKSYKNYSALKMVNKTHGERPWKDAFANNSEFIDVGEIKKFYSKENNRALIYG